MSAPASGVAAPVPEATARAHVAGSVSGQVAVGSHINQVGSVHGDLILHQHRPPTVEPRPRPLDRRPSPFPDLLGRQSEVASAVARLRSGRGTDFHGPAGVGKSSVLRHVAHDPAAGTMPDGVLYCPGRGRPLPDLLQLVFDGFYDAEMGFTPTPGQLGHYVSSLAALMVIDDVELDDKDLGVLIDTLPGCTFLLTSDRRHQWEPGRTTALRGLPEPAALALLERELERPLALEEQEPARALWKALDGHPRRLVQAASLVTDEGRSLEQVAAAAGQAEEYLASQAVAGLSAWEREVLTLVAAVEPAPLPVERVVAICGRPDSAAALEALQVKGLVKANSPRYSLTVALPDGERDARDRWAELALDHYVDLLESGRATPDRFAGDIDAIQALTARATAERRHREVIRLVRLADPVLAVARRWEARSQLVRQALDAARSAGDVATVAWCQHQLGTRAFWLGDEAAAWYRLSRALELRRSLGDREGAEVTQFHLDRLGGPPPGDGPAPAPDKPPPAPENLPPVTGPPATGPPATGPQRRSPASPVRAVVTAALVVLAGAVLLVARDGKGQAPVAVVPIGATAVEVKPSALSFGARPVGTGSSPKSVTLTVKGPAPLDGRGASVQGGDFAVAADRCRGRVEVGRSCRVTVTFSPTAAGDRLATLLIATGDGEVEVGLTGTGSDERASSTVEPVRPSPPSSTTALTGALRADRADVSFGKVRVGSTTPPTRVVVRNTGQAAVKITGVVVSGPAGGDFKVSDTCRRASLAVSRPCEVSITFAPAAAGARVGTLTVTGEGGAAVSVALAGTGTAPQLKINPSEVDFGEVEVGRAARATMTVFNTGTEPAEISGVSVKSPNKELGYTTGCVGTLEPQRSCTISVLFDPGTSGSFSGSVLVHSKAGPPLTATVKGTATSSSSTSVPEPGRDETSTTTTAPGADDPGAILGASVPQGQSAP